MKVYDGSSFIGFAGPYLPLTGGTIAGDVKFNDDEELRFGDDNDLRIYHDGSNSFIKELGTGNLKISADANVEIGSSVTSQAMSPTLYFVINEILLTRPPGHFQT